MKIIRDTREKTGWQFDWYDIEVIDRKLATGDYTIEGLEEVLCIERKKSPSELALNVGKLRKTFEKELQRMSEIRWKYILCEFPYEQLRKYPTGARMPRAKKKKVRMKGKLLAGIIYGLKEKYGFELIFCRNREEAEDMAMSIFDDVLHILAYEEKFKNKNT